MKSVLGGRICIDLHEGMHSLLSPLLSDFCQNQNFPVLFRSVQWYTYKGGLQVCMVELMCSFL
jgi:hypothetical protein